MERVKISKVKCRLFAVAIFAVAVAACNDPEEFYGIGDVVEIGTDRNMVLNSAEFRDDVLEATFTVENTGSEETSYSLWQVLQARDTEGSPQGQRVGCGSDISGTVPPGEQATGSICWDVDTLDVVRIHYMVVLVPSPIAWEVTR